MEDRALLGGDRRVGRGCCLREKDRNPVGAHRVEGERAGTGAPNAQGKKNHMDKSLLSRTALVNFTLSRTFLIHMETPLCAKLRTQHGGTESLILSV